MSYPGRDLMGRLRNWPEMTRKESVSAAGSQTQLSPCSPFATIALITKGLFGEAWSRPTASKLYRM